MDLDCWAEELARLWNETATGGGPASRGVTIAFGGHFSCGKSTIINAALGRELLSADDYPETGALCEITTADQPGATDTAFASAGTKRWEIPCSVDAIRSHVGRISDNGADRNEFEVVDRLELVLATGGPRDGGRWIDTPGINDDAAMDGRARQATDTADIVAWVVSSRQPLSQVELDFLASHVEARGPESVVFLVNVFLPADTAAAWEEWGAKSRATIAARIAQYGADAGIDDPLIVMVSGRAASAGVGDDMGGTELRSLLWALGDYRHPRVVATRLRPVLARLERMKAVVGTELAAAQKAIESAQATALARRKERAAAQRAWFVSYVQGLTPGFVHQATTALMAATHDVVGAIQVETLRRDGYYGETLTTRLTDTIRAEVDTLARMVASAAEPLCQHALSPSDLDALRRFLAVKPLAVAVPDSAHAEHGMHANLQKGAIKVADFGSAARVFVTKAERLAAGRDAEDARAAARAAAAGVTKRLQDSAAGVTQLILERCHALPVEPVELASDERRLADLRGRLRELHWMIERAPQPAGEVGAR